MSYIKTVDLCKNFGDLLKGIVPIAYNTVLCT